MGVGVAAAVVFAGVGDGDGEAGVFAGVGDAGEDLVGEAEVGFATTIFFQTVLPFSPFLQRYFAVLPFNVSD